ncbi:MAG: iron-sulfur protein, partial [Clostridia bacterium]|nr:iron-sulfur protein [Clostridia bacterium]
MEKVSFYTAKEYDTKILKEILEKIIMDQGGFDSLFQKGKRVVIKPNLVMKKKPEAAATTHPC